MIANAKIWRWAAPAAVALVLAVYWRTLAPTVTLEDSGSFIAAAYTLGVAHPPGYPLWCLLAHGFTWLPLGTVAWRVNLFSAVCAAAAAWMLYLTAWRLTRSRPAALAALLALAFSGIFWSQALIAEVYTLNALLCGCALYCAVRWRQSGGRGWLYGLALTAGLGLANHPTFGLAGLAPGVWAAWRHWRMLLRPRLLAACMALGLAGLSVYAYLPWRARAQPPVNWGNPVTWRAAMNHALRRAYYTEPERIRYAGAWRDTAQYMAAGMSAAGESAAWPAAIIALGGWAVWTRRRGDLAGMTLAAVFLNIVVLNLLLRGTAAPDEIYARRVFYIPAQMMLALWLAPAVRRCLAVIRRRRLAARRWAAAVCGLAPLLILAAHWPENDRSQDTLARNFALDIMAAVPADAGLFFVHDEFLFPCLYLQTVENVRPDVQFIAAPFSENRDKPVNAILCDLPPNPALVEYYPFLRDAAAAPWGLVYRLFRPADDMPAGLLLQETALHPPAPGAARDLDTRRVQAAYACHYARLGAERFRGGDVAAANRAWEISEKLKADDPYAHYLLAEMYRHCEVNPVRRRMLLREALDWYRARYSPFAFRFYPLTEADILAAIAAEDRRPPSQGYGAARPPE